MKAFFFFFLLLSNLTFSFATSAAPVAPKDWTLLIFLNGKNNLDSWGVDNLIQMERVGSTDRINVVVEWGSLDSRDTKRLYIQKSSDSSQVTSPVLQDLGTDVDMGDWHTLSDFLKWGIAHYPAKHYLVDVWDHGTGWHERKSMLPKLRPDISHDEVTGHWISTPDLAHAIADGASAAGHKIDIYASDACEMGMIEIANEMRDTVSFYGGSEIDIPARGWPYDALLTKWNQLPGGGAPAEVARLLAHEMVAAYSPGGEFPKSDASFSFYDLTRVEEVNQAVAALGGFVAGLDEGTRKLAIDAATESTEITNDYTDLLDFSNRLKTKLPAPDPGVLERLNQAAARFVIAHEKTDGYAAGLRGISIWFPREQRWYGQYLNAYEALHFSKATHWENTLPLLFTR